MSSEVSEAAHEAAARRTRGPMIGRLARRYLRDRSGLVGIEMIEFALVGPIFIALMCAILETALAFWTNQILENALTDAARLLYTGQFQQANSGTTNTTTLLAKLRDDGLCKVNGQTRTTIFTCSTAKVDVRTVAQFNGSGRTSPVDSGTKDWASGFGSNYTTPSPGDIVIVQAAVKFPVFFTLFNTNQASFADGSRLLQAAVAFRTEPY